MLNVGPVFQRLQKQTFWVYVGELVPRLGGFFIIPVWSARVPPEEYARWVLVLTFVEFAQQITALGHQSFLAKVLYRYEDRRANRYFGLGAAVVLAATAVAALGIAAFTHPLTRMLLGPTVRPSLFVFVGVYLLAFQFNTLAFTYVQCRVRYDLHSGLLVARWTTQVLLLLFFLLVRHAGFYSWVWSTTLSESLLTGAAWYCLRDVEFRWRNRTMARFARRFSFPALATQLLSLGQTRTSRYVLAYTGMSSGVGTLAVAQSFGQVYAFLIRPAKLVASQIMGRELESDADTPYFMEFFHFFALVAFVLAVLLAFFLGDVLRLVVAPAYRGAAAAVPYLVFSWFIAEIFALYQGLMFRYFKVWFQFAATALAFPLVPLLMWALVRRLGFVTGAIAELAAYAAMWGYAEFYARGKARRDFRFWEKAFFAAAALAAAVYADAAGWSIPARAALAAGVVGPFVGRQWRRRRVLFPRLLAHAGLGHAA